MSKEKNELKIKYKRIEYNNAKYEGNIVDKKMEGEGKLEYENGDKYEGTFKDNKKQGNKIKNKDDEEEEINSKLIQSLKDINKKSLDLDNCLLIYNQAIKSENLKEKINLFYDKYQKFIY